MGLREWLIPQDKAFFVLLEEESKNVLRGAEALQDLMLKFENVLQKRKALKDIEVKGDEFVHLIHEKLRRSFITPIDQEDLSRLASRYDDVLDQIYAVANRLYLYKIEESTPSMIKFAELVVKSVKEIDFAFSELRKIDEEDIERRCIEVDRLENEADELLNESVAELFKSGDTLRIIKLKEIYEFLESITDRCEDVSDSISDIAIKYT